MRSSGQVSQRQRLRRDAMRSLQAAMLSGSLLAAPWVFAAGPGDSRMMGMPRLLRCQGGPEP